MKNIITILIVFNSLFILSCSLNTVPEDFVAPQTYYNTATDCDLALTAIYNKMNFEFIQYIYPILDCANDQMWSGTTIGPVVNNFNSADSQILAFWQILYSGIERANMLLERIDNAQINDEIQKNRIKGEAKFLRAYYYFLLVQYWGDVPFKITPTASASDIYYPRTPASEIYDFIYKEMVEAEGLVRPITDYTYAERVSKSAVQGILARVCLYMAGFPNNRTEKYKDALTWAEKVVQSGYHMLNHSYNQVFINLVQDKYDVKESIWEVGAYCTGAPDSYYNYSLLGFLDGIQQSVQAYGYSNGGAYKGHDFFWRKFTPGDTRRDWALASYSYQGSNTLTKVYIDTTKVNYDRFIGKYRRDYDLKSEKQKTPTCTNFPLLRYSDVLLMAAEAENEVSGPTAKALQYLNEVRLRAHAPVFTDIPGKEAFRAIIQDERSRELCFEGLRKQDLVRWNILIPTMKTLAAYVRQTAPNSFYLERATRAGDNVSEQHFYLPIPLREINSDKLLTQNSGW